MEPEVDRGEVNAASLDATERLRARLTGKPIAAAPRPRPVLPWLLAAALLTFALGIIANPWFEHTVRAQLPFADIGVPAASADPADVAALKARLAALERRAVAAPMPSERLARTEAETAATGEQISRNTARLDQLTRDMATMSAKAEAGNARDATLAATSEAAAAQARGALVLVVVRRAVDAGHPLGPLDAALRQSFEARYPAAVSAVSVLGAKPVTLASLRRDLEALRPRLEDRAVGTTTRRTWWDALTDTLSSAVTPAPKTVTPATAPVDAAAAALARGDAAGASHELRRLPDNRRAVAANWLAAADRLAAGDAALATLETATALVSG